MMGVYFACYMGIGRKRYSVFVDSGSPYTFITLDFCNQIQAENPDIRLLFMKTPIKEVGIADGPAKIKIGGTCCLRIYAFDEKGEEVEWEMNHMTVVRSLNTRFLLGQQSLEEYCGKINCKNRIIEITHPVTKKKHFIPGLKPLEEAKAYACNEEATSLPTPTVTRDIITLMETLEIPQK